MIVIPDEMLEQLAQHELSGNELIALMAYGIVTLCQREPGKTAAQIGEVVMKKFPMVAQELAVTAFEVALDAVTDSRFVAYIPSKGVYRGTVAGRLIAAIGGDLSSSGAKVAVQRLLRWAEHPEECEQEMAEQGEEGKVEQVKAQLKSLLGKETLQ